jgi:hypothetical protein
LQDEIATPHADAPFRGSLVDEKMFAIDIHEWDLDNLLEEKRQARLAQIEGIDGRIETAADNASQGDSQHLPCTS